MAAIFVLSHLIADYPLQTEWMVEAKKIWWGRLLHVSVHFLVLAALTIGYWSSLLPFIVALTVSHYLIDTLKAHLGRTHPDWVIGPYILDQALHFITLGTAAVWIAQVLPPSAYPRSAPWAVFLSGYLFVTYVWHISERIMSHKDQPYKAEVEEMFWTRMVGRAAWLTLFIFIWQWALGGPRIATLPYVTGRHRSRALIVDLAVTMMTALLVVFSLQVGL